MSFAELCPLPSPLVKLLEDVNLLPKMLKHVDEDDFPVCRRVCRRWRVIFDKVVRRLSLRDDADVGHCLDLFPHAASLSCSVGCRDGTTLLVAGSSADAFLNRLPRFTAFRVRERSRRQWRGEGQTRTFTVRLAAILSRLTALESLSLPVWSNGVQCWDFLSCLGRLTRLTFLDLCEKGRSSIECTIQEPLTKLQNLQRLSIPYLLLFLADGRLRFLSDKLRTLEIGDCSEHKLDEACSRVQVLAEYAPSLRSLSLSGQVGAKIIESCLTALLKLSGLTSLDLDVECQFVDQLYLKRLTELAGLTRLCHHGEFLCLEDEWNALASFSKLECLELHEQYPALFDHKDVASIIRYSDLRRLTSLTIPFSRRPPAIDCLTNLVHLTTRTYDCQRPARHHADDCSDHALIESLTGLTKLESLKITLDDTVDRFEDVLLHLRRLKDLAVDFFEPYRPVLQAAASLTVLTTLKLYLSSSTSPLRESLEHLSSISQLLSLSVIVRSFPARYVQRVGIQPSLVDSQCWLLSGFFEIHENSNLSRLRRLGLSPLGDIHEEIRARLFKKLPSLRTITGASW